MGDQITKLKGYIYRSFYVKLKKFFKALNFYIYNSFISDIPSHKIRLFYLRSIIGIKIGKDTSINMGCFFAGNNISIGDNTVVARNCHFDGRTPQGHIIIGNNVSISPECYFLSMTHQVDSSSFDTSSKSIIIEDRAWIAVRAMVLPGVCIGKGGVLGANSVATKNIEAFTVHVGSPAKFVKKRNPNLTYKLSYFPYFNTDIT